MGLDIVEIFMRAEEEFEIEIPDADAEELVTVGALADYIEARRPEIGRDEVWRRVRAMVSDEESVPMHLIERDTRWVEDLGFG
jgi:CYTH domain-containing protein